MLQTQSQSTAIWPGEEPLRPALDRLAQALGGNIPGREGEWATGVSSALGGVAEALRRHNSLAEAPDGLLTEIDLTRPTFVRRVSGLRREHVDFLARAGDLRQQAREAAQVFRAPIAAPGQSSMLPEPAGPDGVLDFGKLRREGEKFLEALTHHQQEETDLTQESVTTDIGVGD
jgi:hypothetical protein